MSHSYYYTLAASRGLRFRAAANCARLAQEAKQNPCERITPPSFYLMTMTTRRENDVWQVYKNG